MLKVGDRVRIVQRPRKYANDWHHKHYELGTVFTVCAIVNHTVILDDGSGDIYGCWLQYWFERIEECKKLPKTGINLYSEVIL